MQQSRPLSYRELSHLVVGRYRAERGSRGPTPFFSGDLDQEVLGRAVWPARAAIQLEDRDGEFWVNAGSLSAVTPGAVLAVLPPVGEHDGEMALGYVRVTESTPSAAKVETWRYGGVGPVGLSGLPPGCRCKIVQRDLGDMRLRLSVIGSEAQGLSELNAAVRAAVVKLSADIASMVEIVPEDASPVATWAVRVVAPDEARQFGVDSEQPLVLLVQSDAPLAESEADAGGGAETAVTGASRNVVYARYAADQSGKLALLLERDLQKVFTWQNVWRIAGGVSDLPTSGESDITLDVDLARGAGADGSLRSTYLRPGQRIEIRVRNKGLDDYWVAMFFLDANMGIKQLFSGAIRSQTEFRPIKAKINGEPSGTEGIVLLAIPMREQKYQPDFSILEQPGMGLGLRALAPPEPPATSFGALLKAAATGKGGARGLELEAPDNPHVYSRSWITLPKQAPRDGRSE